MPKSVLIDICRLSDEEGEHGEEEAGEEEEQDDDDETEVEEEEEEEEEEKEEEDDNSHAAAMCVAERMLERRRWPRGRRPTVEHTLSRLTWSPRSFSSSASSCC